MSRWRWRGMELVRRVERSHKEGRLMIPLLTDAVSLGECHLMRQPTRATERDRFASYLEQEVETAPRHHCPDGEDFNAGLHPSGGFVLN